MAGKTGLTWLSSANEMGRSALMFGAVTRRPASEGAEGKTPGSQRLLSEREETIESAQGPDGFREIKRRWLTVVGLGGKATGGLSPARVARRERGLH